MRKYLLALLALCFGTAAQAACPALPYTFVNDTIAQATEVNANFDLLRGCINTIYAHYGPSVTSTGTANAQVLTYADPPSSYTAGDVYAFTVGPGLTNTGATTLRINGLPARSVTIGSASLVGGELVAGRPAVVMYDGTFFQLLAGGVASVAQGGTGKAGSWSQGDIPILASSTQFGSSASLRWDTTNLRLGLGTTSPLSRLHVLDASSHATFTGTGAGIVTVEGQSANGQYVPLDFRTPVTSGSFARIAALQEAAGSSLVFGTSNNYSSGITNAALKIDSGANVLAQTSLNLGGLTTSGSSTICAVNNLFVTGWFGLTFCASDATLKTDIAPFRHDLDAGAVIARLRPTHFSWRADDTRKTHAGFIAQDVAQVIPEAVVTNPDGKLSIETNAVLAYAVKALQEQDERLARMRSWISALGLWALIVTLGVSVMLGWRRGLPLILLALLALPAWAQDTGPGAAQIAMQAAAGPACPVAVSAADPADKATYQPVFGPDCDDAAKAAAAAALAAFTIPAALRSGQTVTVTSALAPAVNGTYPIDAVAQRKITSVAAYIAVNNRFPANVPTLAWKDADGVPHLFPDTATFLAFASAIADYVYRSETGGNPSSVIAIP